MGKNREVTEASLLDQYEKVCLGLDGMISSHVRGVHALRRVRLGQPLAPSGERPPTRPSCWCA